MAIVCFAGGGERAGFDVYRRVSSILGWRRGELKWRKARRAMRRRGVDAEGLVEFIRSSSAYAFSRGLHVGSSVLEARLQLAAQLLQGAVRGLGLVSLAVLDHGLVPERDSVVGRLRRMVSRRGLRRIVFRSSAKIEGIQLADMLAGYECGSLE